MPLFATLQTLKFADQIVGQPGQILVNTCIMAHSFDNQDRAEIIIKIGRVGKPITIKDIYKAFVSIPADAYEDGRTYIFEGIRKYDGTYHILWGS